MLPNRLDLAFQRANAVPNLPAVHLQFGFAGTARTDSAAQTRQIVSVSRQSRQPVIELSQFDL